MRKTWFITGASRGFGALIAARALEQGDRVVATARKPETVTERFGEHPDLLAVALDVTDEAQAHAAAQAAVERFGSIDVLVNNAGYGLLGAVEEATAAEVEALYRTNVFGLLARHPRRAAAHAPPALGPHPEPVVDRRLRGVGGLRRLLLDQVRGRGAERGARRRAAPARHPRHGGRARLLPHRLPRRHLAVRQPDAASPTTRRPRAPRARHAAEANHNQPGDPAKLAAVLVAFVEAPDPPVRLPLGSDTVARIEAENAATAELLKRWRAVSVSTDFAAAESAAKP